MALLAQITEQRTALLGPMLALRGRLEVLVAAAQPADNEGDAAASMEPLKPLVCPLHCHLRSHFYQALVRTVCLGLHT